MAAAPAIMPSTRPHSELDREHHSRATSDFNTVKPSHSGQPSSAAGYRAAAAGTISSVFASIWGSYNQPPSHQQQQQEQQQRESGPSRLHPPTTQQSSSPSVPGGWGNLLSWGPSAGRQKTTTLRKSSTPSGGSPVKGGRSRGAIPFNISAPLEAGNVEKAEGDTKHATQRLPTRADTIVSSTLSPASSPRRKPLAGIFEDLPSSSTSPPHTPTPRSPTSPRSRFHDPPPLSPSFDDDSPGGAYATLSRLQSKPSISKLRSGSGSPFSSAPTDPVSSTDKMPVATTLRNATNWHEAIDKASKLDAHVRRIIFQAGLDYETRPMVVLASCFLPDPREVDYDALLDRIMDAMDLFVENDYTVIYFASGGHHKPGWSWIWRAYRRLDRRFRKNLKKLYIVHPTFFTRSLLQFVHTGAYFISPKFSKKVEQLTTLSALAQHVPITQIDIPPEVLQWNLRFESSIDLSCDTRDVAAGHEASKVFGVDLVQLMGEYGESGGVPRVVRDCVEAILGDFGGIRPVEVEGIFRRSPSSALLKSAEESYDRGHPVSLEQYRDPHIPAVLLKVFLRKLPQPVFPVALYGLIRACPPPPLPEADAEQANAQARETIDYLRNRLLPAIEPACNGVLLSYVLEALHKVSLHSTANKMDAANLATVIAPNLVSSGNAMKDMLICRVAGIASMSNTSSSSPSPRAPHARKGSLSNADTTLGSILRLCIEHYYEIFDEQPFATQVNNVQSLVDRHPHVYRAGAGLDGTPSVQVREHRRGASTTSGVSQASLNTSGGAGSGSNGPGGLGGDGNDGDGDDRSSRATTSRSLASRDAYRPAPNFRGTIGRNSSGSLRLTKGRLGSNANLRSSFTPASSNLAASASGSDTEGLTAQLSGVTLTGMMAVGTFSSPGGSRVRERSASVVSETEEGEGSVPVSPLVSTFGGRRSVQQQGAEVSLDASSRRQGQRDEEAMSTAAGSTQQHQGEAPSQPEFVTSTTGGGVARRKSVRRELSEVAEADDPEP